MEGKQLKNWILDEKGAYDTNLRLVHSADPLPKSVQCSEFVMKVSPLPDIPARANKSKKRKKTAVERNADALYAEHLLYQTHLREHRGLPYLPPNAYGEDQGYRFFVMQRLGRTLEDVVQEHGPVPSSTAAQVGLDLLETLQHIHSKNIVYVDIKPDNFMLDLDNESKVYFVDFGISDRYVTPTGQHKAFKTSNIVGTPTFLSHHCHQGAGASRRDDVEALLYVLIYLMRGNLPWQDATSDAKGAKAKADTSPSDLCADLPSQWSQMLEQARACDFEDRPDYEYYTTQLKKLGAKEKNKKPLEFGTKTGKASKRSVHEPLGKKKAKAPLKKEESPKENEISEKEKNSKKATRPKRSTRKVKKEDEKVVEKDQPIATRSSARIKKETHDLEDDAPSIAKESGPYRRQQAAQRAVAGAVAASAAAKRAERGHKS